MSTGRNPPRKSIPTEEEMLSMPRAALQQLCKACRVKANLKTKDMIQLLMAQRVTATNGPDMTLSPPSGPFSHSTQSMAAKINMLEAKVIELQAAFKLLEERLLPTPVLHETPIEAVERHMPTDSEQQPAIPTYQTTDELPNPGLAPNALGKHDRDWSPQDPDASPARKRAKV
ncbi:hypothetical protein C8R46DRAFT_1344667 [Mycena filopes]|nr:hypothetical protein C8R46DRAFT_1353412 [Mycena filopes]KAJ7181964.1 hypothetical protein C8R46DRAFT_1344667 [Mycena filopes]